MIVKLLKIERAIFKSQSFVSFFSLASNKNKRGKKKKETRKLETKK